MATAQSQNFVPRKPTFEELLNSEKFRRNLSRVQGSIPPDRFIQIALNTLIRTPKLMECTQETVLQALVKLNQADLELDDWHAYLVPYNCRVKARDGVAEHWEMRAQLQISYKGYVSMIRRSPSVSVVKGNVVYQQDEYYYEEGDARRFKHVPANKEGDTIIGAYSFVKFANINDWELDFQPVWKIERARASSRAASDGPWVTHYDEMCIKTVLRHHTKTLQLRPQDREAIQADDEQYEFGDPLAHRALPPRKAQLRDKPDSDDQLSGLDTAASPEADADKEPDKKPGTYTVVIEGLIKKDKVTESEVIAALNDKGIQTGDAGESGLIADLPDQTKAEVVKLWQPLLVTIMKLKAKESK